MAESTSEQGSGVADMLPSCEGLAPVAGEKLPEERRMEGDVKGEDLSATPSMEEGLDRLLHRHRSEIMFELRRLQMGDRPVTGQGHREAVEDFFNQTAPPADGTAGHRTTNHHRPESIIVEVNALVERRPVSSMLQSDLFRRNLETMVRGTLGRLGPLVTTYRPTPTATRRQTVNATLPREPGKQEHTSSHAREPETRQQQSDVAEVVQHQSDQSPTNQTQPQPSDPPSSPEQQHTHAHREAILDAAREAHLPEATPTFAQAWLQQFDARADGTSMWSRLQEAERESLVAEISDLVQRQLVTSTLQSERRDRLERNLRRHVADSGIDGRRAQEALRSLQPSASHRRNDFSNLGIGAALSAGSLSDELDAISVVSATAAVSVPYDQSNRALRHEMQQLRSQMQSLQRSVQLSFDLQLEIQRSIRQEVSASLARCHVTSAADDAISRPRCDGQATTDSPLPPSQPASDGKCLICLDRSVDTVFYQCGHMCVCYTCGMELRARGGNCLMCRAPIRDAIKVYRASMD
ncbi:hypothetical protein NP493_839g00077 [Ridgeia piscesae]|uniref:RING-type domain-containing protein n=1 Tax=Ridgeia piscesae TaxID=27915 RepID=A0AAD9KM86_RIDPI|nr:hypothetical protein NP493_839g00077 [Ridgeia piscesae]